MAVTGGDDYIASVKNRVGWFKTGARTTVAAQPFSLFDVAGAPGPGTLAVGNTANGVVRTDTTAGMPIIPALSGAGQLSLVDFDSSVPCRLNLYDQLFSCGAYAYNTDTTLTAQPSYVARVPGGNYAGCLELWVEAVTAFTGTPSFQISYIDQDGNAGDTGVVSAGAALTVGRMVAMPLASGDSGIQQITRVRATVATAGTFNVHVMRYLWGGRIKVANDGDTHDLFRTGLPQVYTDSALTVVVYTDGTAAGLPSLTLEITDS
jgi:hypothetical protein